jgi:hypothetical protein
LNRLGSVLIETPKSRERLGNGCAKSALALSILGLGLIRIVIMPSTCALGWLSV